MRVPFLCSAVASLALACGAYAAETGASLPPAEDAAKEALQKSPRHGEFVDVPLSGSETKLRTFVAYPEVADKAPVVVVIHEIFGLSDWVMSVADALAKEGFIALAPDLISGMEGAKEDARATIRGLGDEEMLKRLNATLDYGLALPAANGKAACVGFCWGGAASFRFATAQPKLSAAVVYYGTSPTKEQLAGLKVPVMGFYGEDDSRVNSTIPDAEAEIQRLGQHYEKNILKGAGHGFLRQQDGREGANKAGGEIAWPKTIGFLKEHIGK